MEKKSADLCAVCGAPFRCGRDEAECWCTGLPPLQEISPDLGCLCRSCLEKALAIERSARDPGP